MVRAGRDARLVYVRYAALGDSATVGVGDPVPDGWRGWSRLLAAALTTSYDLSYCNLAVSGSTSADVLEHQLDDALAHRPDLASLVVGLNDTMRASFDPADLRERVLTCAEALTDAGAQLLTVRYHDHAAVFGLPSWLARPLRARLGCVNAVYDEVHASYGGHRVDLALQPQVLQRAFWSVDRLHPSELGHRALARAHAELLLAAGMEFQPPSLLPSGGLPQGWRDDVAWLVREGAPWVGRRARDWAPTLTLLPAPRRAAPARR
nr:SGNH/GDSL hydrolase family protein [Nocardioides flavescens]